MNFLVSIGPIKINLSSILSFFTGVLIGFLLLLLLYLYAVLKNLDKGLKVRPVEEEDIDEDEIKWLIEDAQKMFKDKKLRNEAGFGNHLLNITKELINDIAHKFYPDSEYPYLELTIDESIMLSHYITNRVDEVLSSKILSLFRGVTLRKIATLNDTKTNIEETQVVKAAKKLKLGKFATKTAKAIGSINPFYWFKKFTINKAIDVVLVKIGLTVIGISGEETYKIYSKKVFNEEKDLDTGVEAIYQNIARELEGEANEETE